MTSWEDVASKAMDFLKNPTGLGVFIIALFFAFLIYVLPLGVVTWTSWDNTNRLETAILGLKDCLGSKVVSWKPGYQNQ